MNSKNIFGLVLVVGLAGAAIWWMSKPVETAPATTPASAPAAVAVSAPAPVAAPKSTEVVAPVIPPIQVVQNANPAPAALAEADLPADPRADLATAIPDFIQIVDSGDYVTALQNYFQLPPNVSAAQFLAQLQQSPDFSQLVQTVLDSFRATQTVTPAFNDAGDTATYTLNPPVDGKSTIRWKKINGNWMVDAIDG